MKRIISLVLALSMIISMFSFSFASSTLKDITNTKYEPAVEALMELKIVDGYPDKTYLPEKVVTRAELAKLLVTAYGLNQAAEVASGTTPFSDVAGNWAAGYVNVSADYKFVNGYPDGSFKPDETVTYAEALTMCLRVLGYAKEIDSKGTWPTNYIAKAQDLKMTKDLDFKSYNDGATRGNIALLIWNMLRTKMWTVVGESEGDGLESRANDEMINVKFPDYEYAKDVKFGSFSIDDDAKANKPKVNITIDGDANAKVKGTYEYNKNDFYQFVPGTEVEVLVNEEDGEILSIVPTGDDTLANGNKEDLDDKYDTLKEKDYQYAYARVEKKELVSPVTLTSESLYVDKFEKKDDLVKINGKNYKDDVWDYNLILKDGERITLKDLKEGDILTTVTVNYDGKKVEDLYVVGGTKESGKLTRYVTDKYEDSNVEYSAVVVDGKEYKLDSKVTYVVDPTEEDVTANNFTKLEDKMKDEVVSIKLDPIFGRVVRIEFDGKLDGGSKSTDGKFFGIVNNSVERNGSIYKIELNDENDTKSYTFASSSLGKQVDEMTGTSDISGSLVYVKFNSNDEIVEFKVVAQAKADEKIKTDLTTSESKFAYDEGTKEYYGAYLVNDAEVEEDDGEYSIQADNKDVIDLDKDKTIVVVLSFDEHDEDSVNDDEYTIEMKKGIDTITKLNGEDIVVIYDADDDEPVAKYVVIARENSTTSEEEAAIVKSVANDGYVKLVQDADEKNAPAYYYKNSDELKAQDVVVYTTKKTDDDTEIKKVISKLTIDGAKLEAVTERKSDSKYVEIDGTQVKVSTYKDDHDKYKRFVYVEVELDDNNAFDSVQSVEMLKDIDATVNKIKKDDRIYDDSANKTIYLIRGFEAAVVNTPDPAPTPAPAPEKKTVNYTVKFYLGNSGDELAQYVESGDALTKSGDEGTVVEIKSGDVACPVTGYEFKQAEPATVTLADGTETVIKVYFVKVGEAQ